MTAVLEPGRFLGAGRVRLYNGDRPLTRDEGYSHVAVAVITPVRHVESLTWVSALQNIYLVCRSTA